LEKLILIYIHKIICIISIYQQFKQSGPKNTLPTCVEEDDEMIHDIEAKFCKDFTCCGLVLKDLHELLQHFEDAHRMESDIEDDDDLPFEFDDLSSNSNSNDNHLTFNDLFFKDLANKQGNMQDSNLLDNGIGLQNQPIQQAVAMSDIYSEDKTLVDSLSGDNSMNDSSFSNTINNETNINSIDSISQLTTNLSSNDSTSSHSSHSSILNNSLLINIPSTTSNTSKITTPSSATTSNFNLSKNISAFNNVVSGNNVITNKLLNKSGSNSQSQIPNLTNTTFGTIAATSTAATTTANVLATAARTSGFQAVNNLKNLQKIPTSKITSNIQPSAGTTSAFTTEIHSIFPNTTINPFNLLNNSTIKGSTATAFSILNNNSTTDIMNNDPPEEFDDMDMDIDMDDNDIINNESMLMAEAGPDEEKKYRCTIPGCNKSYKNPGGLKYHIQHGHIEDTGDPEINKIMRKPFQCTFENCGKRYKNMNGLKYHIEHSHSSILFNQQGNIGLSNNNQNPSITLDSQQVLALQALHMNQLQQLQHIN